MVIDDKATAINALIDAVTTIERTLGIVPYGVYADVRVRLDILESRINSSYTPGPNFINPFYVDGYGGISISVGDGYPTENRLDGSLYLRKDGYINEGLYSRRDGNWYLVPTDSWHSGGDLTGNYYSQTVIGLRNRLLSTAIPTDGYHLTWNNSDGYWESQVGFSAGNDLSGNKISQTVIGIQGNPVSSNTPSDGYNLSFIVDTWTPTRQAVVFDPCPESQNIRANRNINQSLIDNTKIGIVNLACTNLVDPIGVSGNYSSCLGGNRNIITSNYSVICGGLDNSVSSDYSSILDGYSNEVTDIYSSILNGEYNNLSGQYSSVINGIQNISNSNYNTLNGKYNNISTNSNYSNADGYKNIITAEYCKAFGRLANCRITGQESFSVNFSDNPGYEQFSKVLLNGSSTSGGSFNLTIPNTSSNIEMENGKSYDICLRILIVNTTGTPTCARYIYDILAHQESSVLTLDVVNPTLLSDNGTSWSMTINSSGPELIVQVNSYGTDDRKAFATVEWRELSRL